MQELKGRFRLSASEFTWETLQRSNRIEGSGENNSISLRNVLPRPARLPEEGLWVAQVSRKLRNPFSELNIQWDQKAGSAPLH